MWRGLAPAIMKTLWAGVRGWVAVVRRAGAWVGGWRVGRGFKKLAETLARANFFKKLRLWPDLRDFLIIRSECKLFQ